jgi:hypothetical protein
MKVISQSVRSRGARIAGALTGVLMLSACASTPPPTASLQAARQAISSAERAEAPRYAAEELSEARTELASADQAVKDERMVPAERLADQSRAEAELASARSSAAKATAANAQVTQSNSVLVEELQRAAGDRQ